MERARLRIWVCLKIERATEYLSSELQFAFSFSLFLSFSLSIILLGLWMHVWRRLKELFLFLLWILNGANASDVNWACCCEFVHDVYNTYIHIEYPFIKYKYGIYKGHSEQLFESFAVTIGNFSQDSGGECRRSMKRCLKWLRSVEKLQKHGQISSPRKSNFRCSTFTNNISLIITW